MRVHSCEELIDMKVERGLPESFSLLLVSFVLLVNKFQSFCNVSVLRMIWCPGC